MKRSAWFALLSISVLSGLAWAKGPASAPVQPPAVADITKDELGVLRSATCAKRSADWRDACAWLRRFGDGKRLDLDGLTGKRFFGFGYKAVRGGPGYHHGVGPEDLVAVKRELYMTSFRRMGRATRVAFLHLTPETADEFRDVPKAIAAMRDGKPIEAKNVALVFAEGHRISSREFFSVDETSGPSLLYAYPKNRVFARETKDAIVLLEVAEAGADLGRNDFYIWIFPMAYELKALGGR